MTTPRVPAAGEAALITFVIMGLMFFFGPLLAAFLPLPVAMVAVSVLLLFSPIWFVLRAGKSDVRASLALRPPAPRALAGALCLGVSLWVPAMLALHLVTRLVGAEAVAETETSIQQGLSTTQALGGTLVLFLVSSLLPGFFEELLFRGFLLGALSRQWPRWAALSVSSLVFGAFHGNLPQGASTATLGFFLGLALVHSRSVFVPMLAHATHNALILLLALYPTTGEKQAETLHQLLLCTVLLLPLGLWLVRAPAPAEPRA
jgi:uncharacterized protein